MKGMLSLIRFSPLGFVLIACLFVEMSFELPVKWLGSSLDLMKATDPGLAQSSHVTSLALLASLGWLVVPVSVLFLPCSTSVTLLMGCGFVK